MKKRITAALVMATTLVVTGIVMRSGSADSGPPPIDFITASLRNQETACGRSIEVRYKYWRVGAEDAAFSMRYVRTPQNLFIERTDDHGSVIRNSYDNSRSEFREVHITSLGTKTGSIDRSLQGILHTQDVMDTVRRPLDTDSLIDVIARGTVAASKELVDGVLCWRVDSPANAVEVSTFVIWVDPEKGFCPRRIQINWRDQIRRPKPKIIEFEDYTDIGNGVWFPMQVRILTHIPANSGYPPELIGDSVVVSKFDEVHIDKSFSLDELTVQFPSGTDVTDNLHNMVYKVP